MKPLYEVVIALESGEYARLWVGERHTWRTKWRAEKHAREYKARHLRDAWVEAAQ